MVPYFLKSVLTICILILTVICASDSSYSSDVLAPMPWDKIDLSHHPRKFITSPDGKYAYVRNYGGGNTENSGSISEYTIDQETKRLVPGSTVDIGYPIYGYVAMGIDPKGRWLYATGCDSKYNIEMYMYSIDQDTGGLTQITGSPLSFIGNTKQFFFSPDAKFLYTVRGTGADSPPYPYYSDVFAIDQEKGTLSLINETFVLKNSASSLAFSNDGKNVFVTNHGSWIRGTPIVQGTLTCYSRDSTTGAIGNVIGSISTNTVSPDNIAVHGSFVYLVENPQSVYRDIQQSGKVSVFQVNNGVISQAPGSPYTTDYRWSTLALDPSGSYLYVTGYTIDNFNYTPEKFIGKIRVYSINTTKGSLSAVGSPIDTGDQPTDISVDPTSKAVYVFNYGDAQGKPSISAYSTDAPLLGIKAEVSRAGVTLSGTIINPAQREIKATGFYYSDSNKNPNAKDKMLTTTITTGTFTTTIPLDQINGNVTYYVRPYAETLKGNIYVGNVVTKFVDLYPTIRSFSPLFADIGQEITIGGSGFSAIASDNTVTFSGSATAIPTVATSKLLTVTVPTGAETGTLYVTTKRRTVRIGPDSSSRFTIQRPPTITSFTPTGVGVGLDIPITITGSNFSTTAADNFVTFAGGVTMRSVGTATSTLIQIYVPMGAQTGTITVTTNGVTSAASSQTLTILPQPTITSFTPLAAGIGQTLEITGSGFVNTATDNNVVFGNSVVAPAYHVSIDGGTNGVLKVKVPDGAQSGTIYVYTNGGDSYPSTNALIIGPVPPEVTTGSVTAKTRQSAIIAGTITFQDGQAITSQGVCYGMSPHPTISNNVPNVGGNSMAFSAALSGLTANTTYYARAFATNATGTGYGQDVTFTTASFQVGEEHLFGIVVYVDNTGKHGLVAMKQDLPNENILWINVNCATASIGDASSNTQYGKGKENTLAIATYANDPAHSQCQNPMTAAELAYSYSSPGASDQTQWFLPSLLELEKVYESRTSLTGLAGSYWTSSQACSDNNLSDIKYAWVMNFNGGAESKPVKWSYYKVRAVRYF